MKKRSSGCPVVQGERLNGNASYAHGHKQVCNFLGVVDAVVVSVEEVAKSGEEALEEGVSGNLNLV